MRETCYSAGDYIEPLKGNRDRKTTHLQSLPSDTLLGLSISQMPSGKQREEKMMYPHADSQDTKQAKKMIKTKMSSGRGRNKV